MTSSVQFLEQLREIFPYKPLTCLKKAASYYCKCDTASLGSLIGNAIDSRVFPQFPEQTDAVLEDYLRAQFQYLREVLPDAQETFLQQFYESNAGSASMEAAVLEVITHRSYPKKELSFDVNLYCELIPDPLGSYSHINYIMTDNMTMDAVEFLANIFGDEKRAEILAIVKTEQSLYLSYKKMREKYDGANAQFCSVVKLVQPKTFHKSPDYLQVFEKLFIENEGIILSYLDKKREDEDNEYKRQESSQTLKECQICYGLTPIFKMIKICSVGHKMCASCVKEHSELLYHQSIYFFPCTYEGCKMFISNDIIRSVWDSSRYSKLLEDRLFNCKTHDELIACPFCNYRNGKSNTSDVVCEHCWKKFCISCREVSHYPSECNEKENDICRTIEEKMTEELIRKCPNCKTPFIKERDCCNRIKCPKCSTNICYICREIVRGDSYNHFYGQGRMPSEAPGLCPLNSDINNLHVFNVIDSGKKAFEKLKNENPDVKLLYNPLDKLPVAEKSDALPNQF